MTITIEQMVQREVCYCVSSLVSTLANGTPFGKGDLNDLVEQARELAAPIEDWESAAREAGWHECGPGEPGMWTREPSENDIDNDDGDPICTLKEACEFDHIEPYEREVYEHWIVSDWLADKLAEHGEKVDKDFAGLTVWARTTTGQGIAQDAVIQDIYQELIEA